MWRRSWLSREVLCFSLFFAAIGLCAVTSWAAVLGFSQARAMVQPAAIAAVFFGLCGTLASAYIYLVKARPAWDLVHTPLDFLLSAGLIGSAMTAAMEGPAAALRTLCGHFGFVLRPMPAVPTAAAGSVIAFCWLLNHAAKIVRLRASRNFEMRASFNLLRGDDLWWVGVLSLGTVLVTPVFLAAPLPWLALATAITSVTLQRYLFFVSVVPLSMGLTFLRGKPAHGAAG